MTRSNFSFLSLALMLCINSLAFAQKPTLEAPELRAAEHTELRQGQWIKQEAKIANYGFEVFILLSSADPDFIKWSGIRVVDLYSGKLIQLITADGEGVGFSSASKLVNLVDFNFDGKMDFQIQTADGGAGPNNTANFYAFNRKNKRFVFDKELSEMAQVFINKKNKTIISAYRDGCCHHHEDRYVYRAGRRLHVYEWNEVLKSDDWVETSVGRLSKGKMQYKVKRIKLKPQ